MITDATPVATRAKNQGMVESPSPSPAPPGASPPLSSSPPPATPSSPSLSAPLLIEPQRNNTLGALATAPSGDVYVTDVYGGQLLRLNDGVLASVAADLKSPDALCIDDKGAVYVADFAPQAAIRRILP